ncbi:efflux RND transporter periplasmic adaptor subunit [Flavobacteriales bacterium]|nr:efflux RND transporter periplasmic adaptor subunit [Flavobacteriales bacterium]
MNSVVKGTIRFVLGAAILGAGVGIMNGLISLKEEMPVSDKPASPRAVRTSQVTIATISPKIPVEGRVEALYRMDLITEVTGNLEMGEDEFREGTKFDAGEIILSLDDTESRLALIAQRSQFLQLLSSQLADLQMDFEGRGAIWANYVNELNVNQSLPDLPETATNRERLFLANRGVISSYHSIRSAEERLSKFQVRAPFDGVVVQANVRPGGLVRAGQMAGVLVGEGEYEIKTAVHARYLSTVAQQDSVRFFDEQGTTVASGVVHRVAGNVDPATQSASVFCRVSPAKGHDAAIRDGRFLTGEIKSKPLQGVFEIPLSWMHNDNQVYVVAENQLMEREVEVLFRSRSQALGRGLESGEVVLSEALTNAFDGMMVSSKTNEIKD